MEELRKLVHLRKMVVIEGHQLILPEFHQKILGLLEASNAPVKFDAEHFDKFYQNRNATL